ncbi:MAG: hypothetical protein ACNYPI_03940 [Arenicellales bacterium WSBS_2016_MAG_OTU3]
MTEYSGCNTDNFGNGFPELTSLFVARCQSLIASFRFSFCAKGGSLQASSLFHVRILPDFNHCRVNSVTEM